MKGCKFFYCAYSLPESFIISRFLCHVDSLLRRLEKSSLMPIGNPSFKRSWIYISAFVWLLAFFLFYLVSLVFLRQFLQVLSFWLSEFRLSLELKKQKVWQFVLFTTLEFIFSMGKYMSGGKGENKKYSYFLVDEIFDIYVLSRSDIRRVWGFFWSSSRKNGIFSGVCSI